MLLTSCFNTSSNKIPISSNINISIDGIFNSNEWEQSKIIDITDNNVLYIIQNETHLFLGIKNDEDIGRYVDLYIENDSIGTINFHVSMQLGERQLSDKWNDTIPAWNWGNNDHWIANKVKRIIKNKQLTFLESVEPYQGFEFKIDKNKIKRITSKIRIEIKDFVGKESDIIFPSKSSRSDMKNWFLLELD